MNTTILDGIAQAAVVTFLVSLIKPFVELLPFAQPDNAHNATHDATLRALNVLLNVAMAAMLALAMGGLTWAMVPTLLLQALAQAAGAQVLYQTTTRSGGSITRSDVTTADRLTSSLSPTPPATTPSIEASEVARLAAEASSTEPHVSA